MDKMVSIKGLVIRTTPVIPDMKTGKWTVRSIQGYNNNTRSQLSFDAKFAIMRYL